MHHAPETLHEVIRHALMVTAFVFAMMTIVDYLNVISRGRFERFLKGGKKRQYAGAAFLGIIPGCLGAFATISLYTHGMVSFGALVACMLATSGDEAFVMLALFPVRALGLFAFLLIAGTVWGWLCDRVTLLWGLTPCKSCGSAALHEEHFCGISLRSMRFNVKKPSLARFCIFVIIAIFAYTILSGIGHHDESLWMKITLLSLLGAAFFISLTVPEHFLEEHLWEHLAKEHLWKTFAWVTGTMLLIHFLSLHWHLEELITRNTALVLPLAALAGFIPESGPHLVIVMMYYKGLVPFSVLLASSLSQDGHGMLPLLSVSVKDFLVVKVFKIAAVLLIGYSAYWLGW